MAYRLTAKETIPEGARRVVLEETDSAAALLAEPDLTKRDEAVHEARKSVKKVRGLLRLLHHELGAVYNRENKRLRRTGRLLSELRDAAVLLQVFNALVKERPNGLNPGSLSQIRRGLERSKTELDDRLDVKKILSEAVTALRSARDRSKEWPLDKDGFAAISPGLKRTYRLGRSALKKTMKTQDAVDFHNLRKRVKDHWYHVRLLENLWTEVMQAHEASLKNLETWLGEDHNLVVLREKLTSAPEQFGGHEAVADFLPLIEQQQQKLRADSITLARRLYAEKPRAVVRNFEALWSAWRKKPARKPPGSAPEKSRAQVA
jgi:CHAD domain-containing protein